MHPFSCANFRRPFCEGTSPVHSAASELQDGQLEWNGCDHLAFDCASDGVLYSTIAGFYFKRFAQICHKDGHKMRQ